MARRKNRGATEVNASSMADIAFLLLIFFLVTTTIDAERGITLLLPPKPDPNQPPPDVQANERNIFKVLVNSQDRLLVEDEPLEDVSRIKPMVKEFILNNGRDPRLSDSPDKAIVSFKTNRGTSYDIYIAVLDELKGAYYEIYAERAGVTPAEYRALDESKPREKELLQRGKEGIPMQISIAEPTR
ncbi:MAG: biopolymer transporter ExbD [Bacteroidota bacterium]|nr:biopolymer transporter ExbD [Bacteroidota bacterium]